MPRLNGALEISEFFKRCGRSAAPATSTISRWREKYPDCPIMDDDGRNIYADGKKLKAWGLKHKKIPPTTVEELKAIQSGAEVPEDASEILKDISSRSVGQELDQFLDMEIFDDYPEPTGDVEDELKAARKLRHYYERIVFSWKLDKLGNPKMVKVFQDFASGLTRQIAVIGRLEESLTKQRMRNGKLLDETTVMEWSRVFGSHVVSEFHTLSRDLFDIVDEEVSKLASEAGIDFTLNSDRVLKLFKKRMATERIQICDSAVDVAKKFQAEQVERLGGEENEP